MFLSLVFWQITLTSLWSQTNCPQLVPILYRKEQRWDIHHTGYSLLSWLRRHDLALSLNSTTCRHAGSRDCFHVSTPYPQMPRVFFGYCLIQTEFHQLSFWISGLRTDPSLDRPFWVTHNRLLPQRQASSLSKIFQLYVYVDSDLSKNTSTEDVFR